MNKKICLVFTALCLFFKAYANEPLPNIVEIEQKDFFYQYEEYIEPIVSELSNKLSINPDDINFDDNVKIFAMEYLNHEPIIIVYYDYVYDVFGLKQYICFCLKQSTLNKINVNVYECSNKNPLIQIPVIE